MAVKRTAQERFREATYNRAMALAEAGRGSEAAMRRLVHLIDHGKTEDIQMKAAVHVLNWAIGKPRETIEAEHKGEIILRDLMAERLAKRGDAAP